MKNWNAFCQMSLPTVLNVFPQYKIRTKSHSVVRSFWKKGGGWEEINVVTWPNSLRHRNTTTFLEVSRQRWLAFGKHALGEIVTFIRLTFIIIVLWA